MPKLLKILTGFAAALAAGGIAHGPLGLGETFVDRLDRDLQSVLANVAVPGVTGTVQREPLARTALLSGPADCFQRKGDASFGDGREGTLPGLDRRALTVPGMGRVAWTNPPPEGACP